MSFPTFRYHPDPLKTGSIKESSEACECCNRTRGYIYTGSIYGVRNVSNLCPWCISNGDAHKKFEVEFPSLMPPVIDPNNPVKFECSDAAFDELLYRTPAFSSYQEIEWPNHCKDFCEFHGIATVGDFKKISNEEKNRLFETTWLDQEELESLQKGNEKTELHYLLRFICTQCGELIFQIDPD